jgi:NADH:ubiquinone reductase (H+-translocating)
MQADIHSKIIILGAGFSGLWAAHSLRSAEVDILILDRKNYHTFLPLLYQVASAELEPEDIAYPVGVILRGHNWYNVSYRKLPNDSGKGE